MHLGNGLFLWDQNMTPEEQFRYINNTLQHAAEIQARQEQQLALHDQNLARIERETEKNAAAIRDLIVISRSLVDSQKGLVDSQKRLTDAQRLVDESLAALIQAQAETEQKLQRWIDRQRN
jgi:hypothetical protein